ncbi:MAG: HAD family phosphatase [Chlamydiia bacterium]|nr:HAD family phosphatase [Chlamydiia bacterium]
MALKTVFFDIGNVLVFFSHAKLYEQIAHCTGLSQEAIRALFITETLLLRYEKGGLTSTALYQLFRARSTKPFSPIEFSQAVSDIFVPNYELWPLVELLKQKKIRLVLISNTSEYHFNRLVSSYPIFRLFDDKTLSFEVGSLKPEQPIFQNALSKAQCPPEQCFFTDDIPEFVAGAKKAGLDSEVFVDTPTLQGALVKRGLIL